MCEEFKNSMKMEFDLTNLNISWNRICTKQCKEFYLSNWLASIWHKVIQCRILL